MLIAPRGPGESFTPAERRLLADIAHQAGVAAHSGSACSSESLEPSPVLEAGDLVLDLPTRRVTSGGVEIELTPTEFSILEMLMRHAGQVVTRTMLLENVWDYHFDPQTNVIDVHISRLRSKIDKGFAQPLLHTVRGAGYMIRDDAK